MDEKLITDTLARGFTTAERIRNNVVLILGYIAGLILLVVQIVEGLDLSTIEGWSAAIPIVAAHLGRAQAFGPVTVRKILAEARKRP